MQNQMELTFSALPQNEAFARVAIAAFAVQLNPTLLPTDFSSGTIICTP